MTVLMVLALTFWILNRRFTTFMVYLQYPEGQKEQLWFRRGDGCSSVVEHGDGYMEDQTCHNYK